MLLALSPLPFLLPYLGTETALLSIQMRLGIAALAALFSVLCALSMERSPALGRFFGAGAVSAVFAASFAALRTDPFVALAGATGLIALAALLLDWSPQAGETAQDSHAQCLQRSRWAAWTAAMLAAGILMLDLPPAAPKLAVLAASALVSQALFLHWALVLRSWWRSAAGIAGLTGIAALAASQPLFVVSAAVLLCNLLILLVLLPGSNPDEEGQWWLVLIRQPARILVTSFFLLCLAGSVLLALPISITAGGIAPIDAAFTAVSAVCVTGLVVLDTAKDFTVPGQAFILLLIQLGGLGIMSITTVALHAFGRRLSLRHERLAASMTKSSHRSLMQSLGLILKCTFLFEGLGACLLTIFFLLNGDPLPAALWQGVFTAVSAFCNAGFALTSSNLVAYQHVPLVLHTVALLIILGGLAPATSILIPQWLAGRTVPIAARMALITTVALLAVGTFFFLAFEWYGVLDGLAAADKLHNAWLQSATLRTAGFNSVDLAGVSAPTYLIMLVLMFIGGSPGGTAGGIKTVTLAVLALTFWASIRGRKYIILQKRRIHPGTVFRAVTVVTAGFLIWLLVVMMLTITQRLAPAALIFEATSALGTVGLSIGATPLLDEIGKVIIILAMFIGRIGPLTLFMLLSDEQEIADARYPVERISIT